MTSTPSTCSDNKPLTPNPKPYLAVMMFVRAPSQPRRSTWEAGPFLARDIGLEGGGGDRLGSSYYWSGTSWYMPA